MFKEQLTDLLEHSPNALALELLSGTFTSPTDIRAINIYVSKADSSTVDLIEKINNLLINDYNCIDGTFSIEARTVSKVPSTIRYPTVLERGIDFCHNVPITLTWRKDILTMLDLVKEADNDLPVWLVIRELYNLSTHIYSNIHKVGNTASWFKMCQNLEKCAKIKLPQRENYTEILKYLLKSKSFERFINNLFPYDYNEFSFLLNYYD